MARLENWYVGPCIADPYKAPEQLEFRLHGNVYDDYRFFPGELIHTSAVKGKQGNLVVTNSGTRYELGVVDPNYEKAYPQARERVFATLPEIA
jgi:hypothetical protein